MSLEMLERELAMARTQKVRLDAMLRETEGWDEDEEPPPIHRQYTVGTTWCGLPIRVSSMLATTEREKVTCPRCLEQMRRKEGISPP